VQADETEKESLPDQERRLRAIATAKSWQVVDLLKVPGHSRVYYNFDQFTEAALLDGIDAGARLTTHWERQDFDVFVFTDGDRFGREQSIFSEVVARTIDAGAFLYSAKEGEIMRGNHRMYAAMAGYRAASEIDEMKRRYQMGMDKLAERGAYTGSYGTIWSHRLVRDELGKVQRIEVDPDKLLIFQDAATIILEHVAWSHIERELFTRFGHGEDGRPFPPKRIYYTIMHPVFWGHSARKFRSHDLKYRQIGHWVFDESITPNPPAQVWRNTHQPMWTGELAERIKAEIRWRSETAQARAARVQTHLFTGLLICDQCGKRLSYYIHQGGRYSYLSCDSRDENNRKNCPNSVGIRESDVEAFFRQSIHTALQSQDWSLLLGQASAPEPVPLDALEARVKALATRLDALIDKQVSAPTAAHDRYRLKIEETANDLQRLQARLDAERAQHMQRARHTTIQTSAIKDVVALGETVFWSQSPDDINKMLRAMLGVNALVVRAGKIIGAAPFIKKKPHFRKN
jgi:DNA invertase Pin-like site-specific DNA recombinase